MGTSILPKRVWHKFTGENIATKIEYIVAVGHLRLRGSTKLTKGIVIYDPLTRTSAKKTLLGVP